MILLKRVCFLFFFFFLMNDLIYAQNQADIKKYQIDLALIGPMKIKKFYDASTIGLGFIYKQNYLTFNSQLLYTSPLYGISTNSKGYIDFDLLIGLRKDYKKIEMSIFSGLSFIYRRQGATLEGEKSAFTIGLPIKCKLDYKLGEKFAIGLMGYYSVNTINSIYGLNLNLGFRI